MDRRTRTDLDRHLTTEPEPGPEPVYAWLSWPSASGGSREHAYVLTGRDVVAGTAACGQEVVDGALRNAAGARRCVPCVENTGAYPTPASSEDRIAWRVDAFRTRREAEAAVVWLDRHDVEHRGILAHGNGKRLRFYVWRR